MPQVDRGIAKARAKRLRELGDRQFDKLCASRLGAIESVLVESEGLGRTEQFVPVEVSGFDQGEIVPMRVTGITRRGLSGAPIQAAA